MGLRAASSLDVKSGDAADAWSAAIDVDKATQFLSLECWDENLEVQLSYDGTNFLDAFEIDKDRPIVFPFQAKSMKVRNKSAGSTSRYQAGAFE